MSLVWTLPTEKAKNAVKNLSPDELAEELNYNLNKVHPSSLLIDGINSSVGLLLRPFRDVDETAITSLPPPKGREILKGNFGVFNFPQINENIFPISALVSKKGFDNKSGYFFMLKALSSYNKAALFFAEREQKLGKYFCWFLEI